LVTDKKGLFISKKYWQIFNKIKSQNKKYVKKLILKDQVKKITQKIYKIGYWPIIIFSFGKQKCFELLLNLKKQNFCEQYETKITRSFFRKCFSSIISKNKKFPSIKLHFLFF
jgi:superfamily II RNA helicase